MSTRIKMMARRMPHCYPAECDITDERGDDIIDNDLTEDDISNKKSTNNDSNTFDPVPDTPGDNIVDNNPKVGLDNDDATITTNLDKFDHHVPIV